MITAEEARELAGPTIEEQLAPVFELIRQAATKKKRELRLHSDLWTNGAYTGSPEFKEAKKLLQDQGFVVDFYYNDGGQFADLYTIVKW